MEGTQLERKRAALSTVGRGSKGLLGFWDLGSPIILVGTALTQPENKIHVLRLDKEANEINQCFTVQTPAEAWSFALISGSSLGTNIVVAERRKHLSAVAVWRLPSLTDFGSSSPDVNIHGGINTSASGSVEIDTVTSIPVHGFLLRVRRNSFSPGTYLAIAEKEASVLDLSNSSVKTTLPDWSTFELPGSGSKLVDGDWRDANTAFLVSADMVGLFDTRSGNNSSVIDIRSCAEKMQTESQDELIPRTVAKASSACSDGANIIYVGGKDGFIRAFDIRKSEMLWEARHERGQWVSSLLSYGEGFLSGGTDGVVRSWTKEGNAIGTFPQHDDTVTNMCCSSASFASVSYDGRLAVNDIALQS